MTRRERALAFLRAFCEGRVEALAPLPAEDLVFEGEEGVCVFFLYRKGGASTLMAQWNRFRGKEIAHITLLFDGGALGGTTP